MEEIITVIIEQFIRTETIYIAKNLLDVFVIAYLIYKFFTLLKGTEAIPIIIGLILISIIYQIFSFLELNTAEWLFSNLSQYTVLILVIIFKDDIRKTLAKIGQNNYKLLDKKNTSSNEIHKTVEELIKSMQILSKKRIGALILIEKEAELEDVVTGQIAINSNLKKEIIEAIFHHNSPIHDGALIIRNDKILFAGAFLPLSLSKNIPAHFGTRHRAGIGISERTDAVVLIVSEETGNISIAFKGNVTTFSDTNEVRKELQKLLFEQTPEKKEIIQEI